MTDNEVNAAIRSYAQFATPVGTEAQADLHPAISISRTYASRPVTQRELIMIFVEGQLKLKMPYGSMLTFARILHSAMIQLSDSGQASYPFGLVATDVCPLSEAQSFCNSCTVDMLDAHMKSIAYTSDFATTDISVENINYLTAEYIRLMKMHGHPVLPTTKFMKAMTAATLYISGVVSQKDVAAAFSQITG